MFNKFAYTMIVILVSFAIVNIQAIPRAEALVQWLNLPSWKVGDRGLEPHSGLQVSKQQNVSSPLTRKDSILWGASVTER